MGVHYAWFHTYRAVGPKPTSRACADAASRSFACAGSWCKMRSRLPIAIVDAYWDDKGEALCPMATGVSHHISPYGDIEPCPIIQFARETIHDERKHLRDHERIGVPARLPRDGGQGDARLRRAGASRSGARPGRANTARATPRNAARRWPSSTRCSRATASTSRARRFPRITGRTGSPRSIGFSDSERTRKDGEMPYADLRS